MVRCWLVNHCGSDSKLRSNGIRHFFHPPKDPILLQKWSSAILFQEGRVLTAKDSICDLHFRPEEIISHFETVINGVLVRSERARWTLIPDVVPSIFPGNPEGDGPGFKYHVFILSYTLTANFCFSQVLSSPHLYLAIGREPTRLNLRCFSLILIHQTHSEFYFFRLLIMMWHN